MGLIAVVSGAVRRALAFPPVQRHELGGIGGEVPVEDLPSRQRHDNPLGILPRSIDASPEFQFVPPGFEHRIGILRQPPELNTHRLDQLVPAFAEVRGVD